MIRFRVFLSLAAIAWIAAPAAYAAWPPLYEGAPVEVPVTTKPIPLDSSDPARTQVGRLSYLGGVEIRAGDKRFGGLSDMLWDEECNRLLVVSDTGLWVVLVPREESHRLVGLEKAYMAPILDLDGKPASRKRDADAEALMRDGNGNILVWFEQDHRAQRYRNVTACQVETLGTKAEAIIRLPEMAEWPENGGAEAVARSGAEVFILSESQEVGDGGRQALRVIGETSEKPEVKSFIYQPPAGFSPTAMAMLHPDDPDSPMLILHRHFSLLRGVAAVLGEARLTGAPVQTTVQPTEIARLGPPLAVDNMEAIAVRTDGGRRFVYLLSDDNFNPMQKTILLKFELLPAE